MTTRMAAELADERVARVVDDPEGRLALLRDLYRVPPAVDRGYLPYRNAASAFLRWQLRRGVLHPVHGSPWWRAVNLGLLRDTCEASALAFGHRGAPRTPGAAATLAFIRAPSARSWYLAHNLSIASAYLDHRELAEAEDRVERFFLNLVLLRVLFAHALVSEPRLALGRLAPLGRVVGDPRLGMTGIFLSLSRVLPDRYPLGDDVEAYVVAEHGFGHALDVGVILPRAPQLYAWSAEVLDLAGLRDLLDPAGTTPTYAWDPVDDRPWRPPASRWARAARHWVGPARAPYS
ncbi:hypothetical protein [uncultured Nocardioides sp.]|uniref:hypothetical protein n=1 Tax=uncultured Nocardioides sp. TaxID=198441 RepID=UPI00262F4774|nr:hypothetical protein [uncultured Nocardioides sp.]